MATIEKRFSKNGKTSYRVKIRMKGSPILSETFPNLTMARDWAAKTETRIKEGMNFSVLESRKHTLAELIDKYESSILPNKHNASAVDTARHLHEWHRRIGYCYLANLTPALINKTRAEIADTPTRTGKPKSNSTINRYLAALSVVLSYAVKELEWLDINPMTKVSKMPEPRGRVRYLSDDERTKLLEQVKLAQNPYLYPAVLLALTTGARRMEVLGLKWQDINLEKCWIVLQDTKNGERRGIPLVEPALSAIKHLYNRRKKSDYVFPSHNGTKPFDITRSWHVALSKAGIEDFHFHDLRHTCASYLAMNGATMGEIATVLGHKTLQMTKRYSHLSDAHTQSLVEKMNQKIFRDNK